MNTPICDYVNQYVQKEAVRLHMPGHKGKGLLGIESRDITEISGADSLYEAQGIIRQSQENATSLFGCPTFYSTEGSSQCIRAMVHLAMLHARKQGKQPCIAAGRNAHRAFLTAVALLDVPVLWLYGESQESYLSCRLTPESLEGVFAGAQKPTAVYLTSPDYLGNVADIGALAKVCHAHGALLLVDNAHGAYLRFLETSLHPMDLGADLCCDSAHKTLPVLTGGAYLHTTGALAEGAPQALALFGSTSPSYLILQSLDACNAYLESYGQKLRAFLPKLQEWKSRLRQKGFLFYGNEPMKLTLCPKPRGYLGTELAQVLEEKNLFCEFADPDHLVLMPTPETGEEGLLLLEQALLRLPPKTAVHSAPPAFHSCRKELSIREAMLSVSETLPVQQALGRVAASPCVGCPPAVPIVVSGERVDENALEAFQYYGITHCTVVK